MGSYYHSKDSSVTIADFMIVSFISYIADCLYTVLLSVLFKIFSPIWIIFIGASLSSIVVFLTSYIENPILFCWTYGLSLGILSGSVFLPSTIILWEKLPKCKGTTTGILLAGFNLGSGVFGLIFTYMVNPNNYSAAETQSDGEEQERYFGENITDSVPASLRWVAVIYFISGIVGIACLSIKSDTEKSSENSVKVGNTIGFMEMIKIKKFWHFFGLLFLGLAPTSYIMVTYKVIGIIHINDDYFLSYIGTIMFVTSSAGRFIFGILLDAFSYKKLMVICYLLITVFILLLDFCLDMRYLFGFLVVAISFTSSGIYNGILLEMEKNYPNDKWMISYVCVAEMFDFLFPFIAEENITPEVGYFYTFCILSGFSFVSMIFVIFYTEPNKLNHLLIEP